MIRKLPPQAEEIIIVLSKHDSLRLEEIQDMIPELNEKTLRYAMRRLLENGVVKRIPNLLDMRSVSYRIATPDEFARVLPDLSTKISDKIITAMEEAAEQNQVTSTN
jgi:hypothetical protein